MKTAFYSLLVSAALTAPLLSSCSAPFSPELEAMAQEIHTRLDGEVVGYAYVLHDLQSGDVITGAQGLARLDGDGGPMEMSPDRRMIIASVSKWVTALGTLSVLQSQGLSPDTPIGPYFPSDWNVEGYLRSVTFGQLMSNTSGIKDFGNGLRDYVLLQEFFTQPVDPEAQTGCDGPWAETPQFGVTPRDQGYCYSNYNAGILQILLPRLAGYAEDTDLQTRPRTLAQQFEAVIQHHVFEPVGVTTASCTPGENDYALSYIFPGSVPGKDWGPQPDRCATGGWYASPRALASITASVATADGLILREDAVYSSLSDIGAQGYGLDRNTPQMMEKAGVLGDDPGVLATSNMIRFDETGAPHLVAVLFINSTNSEVRIAHARPVLEAAYAASYEPDSASE